MHTRPPRTVNMHQAKTNLSELVEQAVQGVPIVLARSGQPVARIIPIERAPLGTRPVAMGRGQKIEAAFLERSLAPLAQEDLEGWEGSAIYPEATESSSGGAPRPLFICLVLLRSKSGEETILAQGQLATTPEHAIDNLLETLQKSSHQSQTPDLSLQLQHLRPFLGRQGSVIKVLDPEGSMALALIQAPLVN